MQLRRGKETALTALAAAATKKSSGRWDRGSGDSDNGGRDCPHDGGEEWARWHVAKRDWTAGPCI